MKSIGVDRGGSYTRVSIFDDNLNEIKNYCFETEELPEFVEQMKKIINEEKAERFPMVVSSKGAMSKKNIRDYITNNLSGISNLKKVISDAEGAHRAAFKEDNGFLIIMGTGSVLIHKLNDKYTIEGGKNPPEGDPGSGKWIGLKYLKTILNKEPEILTDLTIAAYAKEVIEKAKNNDNKCMELVNEAIKELCLLIISALKKYENLNSIKIALVGGLSNNEFFIREFKNYSQNNIKNVKINFFKPDTSIEKASAIYALSLNK